MNGETILGLRPKAAVRLQRCELCRSGCFEDSRIEHGECRKEPPKMQFVPAANKLGQTVMQTIAAWPNVKRDQWCSDGFQPVEMH